MANPTHIFHSTHSILRLNRYVKIHIFSFVQFCLKCFAMLHVCEREFCICFFFSVVGSSKSTHVKMTMNAPGTFNYIILFWSTLIHVGIGNWIWWRVFFALTGHFQTWKMCMDFVSMHFFFLSNICISFINNRHISTNRMLNHENGNEFISQENHATHLH